MSISAFKRKARTRVLVVDDDEAQAMILASSLETVGFEADIVTCGISAIWKATEGRYDVALLDYHLPKIDGLAAARLIGDLMAKEHRPILIARTATPDALAERETADNRAFDVIISKSCNMEALLFTDCKSFGGGGGRRGAAGRLCRVVTKGLERV